MNEIRLDTRELDRIAKQTGMCSEDVMRDLAFQMEAEMKQRAAYDTGAMRDSVYTVTKESDGYQQAAAEVTGKNPDAETAPHPTPSGKVVANVGPSVEYAVHQEFGTSKMAAQPFVIPAAEQIGNKLNDGSIWRRLFA
jgi:HK97 gp10 family phage protein